MSDRLPAHRRLMRLFELSKATGHPESLHEIDRLLLELFQRNRDAVELLTKAVLPPFLTPQLEKAPQLDALRAFSIFEEHLRLLYSDEVLETEDQTLHQTLYRILFGTLKPSWDLEALAELLEGVDAFIDHPEWLEELRNQSPEKRDWHTREACDGAVSLGFCDFKTGPGTARLCEDAVGAFETTDLFGCQIYGLMALDGMSNRLFEHLPTLQHVPNDNVGKWLLNCALRSSLEEAFGTDLPESSDFPNSREQYSTFCEALEKAQSLTKKWLQVCLPCLGFSPRESVLQDLYPDEFERLQKEILAVMEVTPVLRDALKHYYLRNTGPASNVMVTLVFPNQAEGIVLSVGNGTTFLLPQSGPPRVMSSDHFKASSIGLDVFDDSIDRLVKCVHTAPFTLRKGDTLLVTTDGLSGSCLHQVARSIPGCEDGVDGLQHMNRVMKTSKGMAQGIQGIFPAGSVTSSRDDMCMAIFKKS